jgi:hypothetical protein
VLKIGTSESSPLILTPELTSPLLYLDYCVIGDLAENPALGGRLRDCLLEKEGTLYLSWAHLTELFGFGFGPTYNSIRSYLASFGRSFVLIDSDAQAVIDREANWKPGKQNPVIDEDFLHFLASSWDGMSNLDITILLDPAPSDKSVITQYQTQHRRHKENLKQTFDGFRNRYRTDRDWRRKIDNEVYSYEPGTPPTDYIYKQMSRECVITNEQFNASDGLDFEHCVVSLAYCDYVVLDKKWARRCKKIIIPPTAATVFSSIEVEALLSKIQSWSKVPIQRTYPSSSITIRKFNSFSL